MHVVPLGLDDADIQLGSHAVELLSGRPGQLVPVNEDQDFTEGGPVLGEPSEDDRLAHPGRQDYSGPGIALAPLVLDGSQGLVLVQTTF